MRAHLFKAVVLALALRVGAAGCTASKAFSQGDRAARAGDWDTAVAYYTQAFQANPESAEYKIALERADCGVARAPRPGARPSRARARLEAAIREYRRRSEFDPTNRQAPPPRPPSSSRCSARPLEAARPVPAIQQMREKARQASQSRS